jgi:hypothetical protein
MEGLKASFERELKNKLQQKASGVQSEEQVLHKSFKYFDLNNSGAVEPDEFAKACEKIGIMIPTKQVSFLFFFDTSAARFLLGPFYFNLKLIINISNFRSQI